MAATARSYAFVRWEDENTQVNQSPWWARNPQTKPIVCVLCGFIIVPVSPTSCGSPTSRVTLERLSEPTLVDAVPGGTSSSVSPTAPSMAAVQGPTPPFR
ncbi:Hypothetical protein NTJ_12887 [Nesidiocoris tenuis]|uniref:Uncharacterized protein n=1 Tax=Nesidiocoris tenuis TaxID=355587 RepID=A0ABN7B6N8_9HEMI|nr:Hypothetical protein NTJ_12887 [Nesidiocoris tenuis]